MFDWLTNLFKSDESYIEEYVEEIKTGISDMAVVNYNLTKVSDQMESDGFEKAVIKRFFKDNTEKLVEVAVQSLKAFGHMEAGSENIVKRNKAVETALENAKKDLLEDYKPKKEDTSEMLKILQKQIDDMTKVKSLSKEEVDRIVAGISAANKA